MRILVLFILLGRFVDAQSVLGPPPSLKFTILAQGISKPTVITNAGDGSGRLFIAERGGLVRVFKYGAPESKAFLDISTLVLTRGGEQGLLGLAFPPNFAKSGNFYVDYTGRTGIGDTVIARYSLLPGGSGADPRSAEPLLTVTQPFPNHNGGQLAFGPDGLLYIGLGDGGGAGDPGDRAQDLKSRLGKILRIDVAGGTGPYAIPRDNPFGDEIWAYGLRNPWRFSFDRLTGDLFIADVGQDLLEEIDYQPRGQGGGANYGWRIVEGSRTFSPRAAKPTMIIPPIMEYEHSAGDCSVTGGYVYRGRQEALEGFYFYADYCSGRIWGLRREAGVWRNYLLADTNFQISTFGEDEEGELYFADYATGVVYRLEQRL